MDDARSHFGHFATPANANIARSPEFDRGDVASMEEPDLISAESRALFLRLH